MRKFTNALASILGIVALIGCNPLTKMINLAEEQQLTVTPSPLEVHADTVSYEMAANLPVKMLQKGKVYTIKNIYKYGDQEVQVGELEFRAEDYPNSGDQQPRLSKEFSFAYEPAMKDGDLMVQGVASDPASGDSQNTPQMKVADGVIATSKMVKDIYYAAYADHGYNNKEELVPTNVTFYFEQGRSVLRPGLKIEGESNREKQNFLSAFIAEKNVTRSITITGHHSPEGAETINTRLAEDRPAAVEKYYRRQMRKFDYKDMADEIKFVNKPIKRDWTEFKKALSNYDGISEGEKNQYLEIVNGSGSFEEKEDRLHKLSTYNKVFRDIYPPLRYGKTDILTVKEKKPDAVIGVLAVQIADDKAPADTLSKAELMFGATLTPSLQEKEKIYKSSVKKDPSWAAHNNLGAVYLEMAAQANSEADRNKYVDMAISQLDIAKNKNAAVEVHINLAVAYTMQGNDAKAYETIQAAAKKGASGETGEGLNSVKGSLEIKMAEYQQAISSTSNGNETADNLFNKALAQLLNEEYQNAITSFDQVNEVESDYADAYYGAAIANAGMQNEDGMASNLKKAVEIDPTLKQAALDDLVFQQYASSQAFQNALK